MLTVTRHTPELEWAWAAGLFEGEGCISIPTRQPRTATLIMKMTDPDVMERFARIVGVGSVRRYEVRGGKYQPVYQWRIARRADVEYILGHLIPFFGERRRAKAETALLVISQTPYQQRRKAA